MAAFLNQNNIGFRNLDCRQDTEPEVPYGQVECFIQAVEARGFRAAARVLGLTPSGMSNRVRLQHGVTRRVVPTEARNSCRMEPRGTREPG